MKDIIEIINSMEDVIHGKKVKESEVANAEAELGIKFSDDYRCYVKSFGCMTIGSREFTGISKLTNYDVVSITISQRQYNTEVPADWYVIEQLNIDEIVIWQSEKGEIYQTSPNTKPKKICDSFVEYIIQ
ncbi:SMI1/KNR4 family protein [Ruminococcus sp.]|uniref:SMI1/KNR4 family protein n=1 Tax=Ruminococcus sp. TaxID=41978 RepID=UPI0025F54E00|nr:SMI1/KNR4 family protein [Ruminococcus sp.]